MSQLIHKDVFSSLKSYSGNRDEPFSQLGEGLDHSTFRFNPFEEYLKGVTQVRDHQFPKRNVEDELSKFHFPIREERSLSILKENIILWRKAKKNKDNVHSYTSTRANFTKKYIEPSEGGSRSHLS